MQCNHEIFMEALYEALDKTEFMVKMLTGAMQDNKSMVNELSIRVVKELIKADTSLLNILANLAPHVDPKPDFDSDLVNMLLHNNMPIN